MRSSAFKGQFQPGKSEGLVGTPQDEPVDNLQDEDVDQERIVRQR